MDTVQALLPQISQFVVTGFSKRGAATWLTAAVDHRVKAIAPGVFDVLNFSRQAQHHVKVYGCFAPALKDYNDYQIFQRINTPEVPLCSSWSIRIPTSADHPSANA